MTCVVGLKTPTTIIVGADSAGVGGWDLRIRADEKVFRTGPYLIGYSSSFRMGQLLRYSLLSHLAPLEEQNELLFRYMVTLFVDGVRQCLKDGGYAEKHDEREEGGQFIVGVRDRLFVVDRDYQVEEFADPYAAVGCGAPYALGSLHATDESALPASIRVQRALEAAERFSSGVRGPFVLMQQPTVRGEGVEP